jgi:hypothetical protein
MKTATPVRLFWVAAALAGIVLACSFLTALASAASAPSIAGESVSSVTPTNTLEAQINPQGAPAGVFYQFQLLHDPGEAPTELACPSSLPGYSVCAGPEDADALPLGWIPGTEAKRVSLDLASAGVSLEPGRTYYFRVLAADRIFSEDVAEWEPPAIVGASKKFTTPPSSAEPLAMTFTEDRANVGVQLSDAAMFTAPATAPFAAQIDPGSGSITAGVLEVPDFTTHITEPLDADVNVHFEIGIIEGAFNQASGALSLEGEANATLTSDGEECSVSTTPNPLILSSAGTSGGASPRPGVPFTHGLTGAGAIAGQWTDMSAAPKVPGQGVFVCATVDERIEGPGGIWLVQEGDVVPPAAPQLTGTDPASPGPSATPRILGSAEVGSTVRLYSGAGCAGAPIATASAAQLSSPGILVEVPEGSASFSASATDAAGNASACSLPISYTRLKVPRPKAPTPQCIVPKLIGKTLKAAKRRIKTAGCMVGKVRKPKRKKRRKLGRLVVESTNPSAGEILEAGSNVNVKLVSKPQGLGDNWQQG